ncbi:MAG: NADPH-dependent glutamate synthase [Clostridia bacterium]|nr:NADPH-dependent glutamate synthase [Clostridia bacterium]MBQ3869074.1 NADPH-dependent glutamate synthase [Clostridia bacterium]
MPNMQLTKTKMPELEPAYRASCFEEVAVGYSAEDAVNEAKRCLNCKNRPCVSGCPVNVRIPDFIAAVAEGDFERGYEIITGTNSLPAVCGRVCPQESQCEGKCVRGIKGEPVGIGRLERFCADYHRFHGSKKAEPIKPDKEKVAVVGSGPSSLTCAGDLCKLGYDVTVFEAFHTAGGVLVYGIPEFRLPKSIVSYEIDGLKAMGVKFVLDSVIGRIMTVDELFDEGFKAVFIGTGAGLPGFLGIPGENGCGVYSANEFLTRVNLMKAYLPEYDTPIKKMKKVAVVGGGNVAMDAARCAKRLGADEVYIIYRRSEEEMPARAEEIHHAKEEGVIFRLLNNPVKINTDERGNVVSATVIKMELGEPDASGRRRPVPVEGSEYDIELDAVIVAVGTTPNPLIRMTTPGLETNRKGCIVTSDGVTTSREGVFAGGDAVTGAATVILAMGAGKQAAEKIDGYLSSKR